MKKTTPVIPHYFRTSSNNVFCYCFNVRETSGGRICILYVEVPESNSEKVRQQFKGVQVELEFGLKDRRPGSFENVGV